MARWLTPSDYGVFALAYSVFVLLLVVHSALLTNPMMVFGSGKYSGRFAQYLHVLIRMHFALTLPAVILLAAAAFVLGRTYSEAVVRAFLALAIACPFILLLWLLRRAFYVRLAPHWAAVGGGFYLLVLLGSALALRIFGRLTAATGILAMACASIVACVFLLLLLRPISASTPSITLEALGDHWRYGKWAVAGAGPGWLVDNVYFLVLPAWVGLAEAGALKALLNLAMPALQSISALAGLLLPLLVRKRDRGGSSDVRKTTRHMLGLLLLGSTCYLAILIGLRSYLFHFLYGDKYSEHAGRTVLLLGLLPLVEGVAWVLAAALGALERPDLTFWSAGAGAVVALAVGVPISIRLGAAGALLGILVTYVSMGLIMFFFLVHTECCGRGIKQ
jgi:O-antigen/teichoic acid export membrane protein